MIASDFQEIPNIFYSYQTQKPFSECLVCSCYLLDDQIYVIEKALKKHPGYTAQDVIFDYAICLPCALKMREEFSKDTLAKINAYFLEYVVTNPPSHQEDPINIDCCLDHCVVKKTPISEITDYQIYAHFKGNKLINHEASDLKSVQTALKCFLYFSRTSHRSNSQAFSNLPTTIT